MAKKAMIRILLVEESDEEVNEKIEREIFTELLKQLHVIPWAAKIEKVTVKAV